MVTRLIGRYPVEDVIDPNTGEVLASKDDYIKEPEAERIVAAGV